MSGVFIISAPSGSGKSTLVNRVREIVPGLKFSISYTTRAPRTGEQNGREYFFVSRAEFENMIDQNDFLEHDPVVRNGVPAVRADRSSMAPMRSSSTPIATVLSRVRPHSNAVLTRRPRWVIRR